jgi:hypothetical protein
MTPAPARPGGRLAVEVTSGLPLTEAAIELLKPIHSVREYLDQLLGASLTMDVLRVLSRALPKPLAVWWGYLCVVRGVLPPRTVPVEDALEAVATWASSSGDAQRRACGNAAEAAGWDTAAGCLAGAAWLSGGSLSPVGLPAVEPRDDLTAQTLIGALQLAAVDPKRQPALLQQFQKLGLAVASGQVLLGQDFPSS